MKEEATKTPPNDKNKTPVSRPEVILDFVFEQGLFYIVVENISDRPALEVSTRFEPQFRGVEGQVDISKLPLFENIEYLAPHKSIRTFLDTSAAYFERGEPTRISVHLSYHDKEHRQFHDTIHHDLSIYRDIGYIRRVQGSAET